MEVIVDEVRAAYIWPVKGLRPTMVDGELPTTFEVGTKGLECNGFSDREFVLYDVQDNTFVTARGWNAQRQTAHRDDHALTTVETDIRSGKLMIASSIGTVALTAAGTTESGQLITVDLFGKPFRGADQGEDAADYFSELLQRQIRVLRADTSYHRQMSARNQREGTVCDLSGQDGTPLLMVSRASWDQIMQANGLDPAKVTIDRTRPNIVLSGDQLGAFNEDRIDVNAVFWIGMVGARIVKACVRCPVPNIDPQTGNYDGQVSKALASRVGENAMGDKGMLFGQGVTYFWTPGQTISVGDRVVIPRLAPEPNVHLRKAL